MHQLVLPQLGSLGWAGLPTVPDIRLPAPAKKAFRTSLI